MSTHATLSVYQRCHCELVASNRRFRWGEEWAPSPNKKAGARLSFCHSKISVGYTVGVDERCR